MSGFVLDWNDGNRIKVRSLLIGLEDTVLTKNSIAELAATFPETFGLRGFPGEVFRISVDSSYLTGPINQPTGIMLYTQRRRNGVWTDFIKCSEAELRREMVELAQPSERNTILPSASQGDCSNPFGCGNRSCGRCYGNRGA